ncbi:MAG: hypothetical protein WBP22_04495 [Candidatus Saccharimonas sp.]
MYDPVFGILLAFGMVLCILGSFVLASMKHYDPSITDRRLALRDLQLRQNEVIYMINCAVSAVTAICTVPWLFTSQTVNWNIVPVMFIGVIAGILAIRAFWPVNHPDSRYGITLAK